MYMDFDSTGVERPGEFTVIPDGDYEGIITKADISKKDGTNNYRFAYTFEITDGEYKGTRIMDGANYIHTNAIAEKIGKALIASLCDAIGIVKMKNSEECENKPIIAMVNCKGQNKDGSVRNQISKFKSIHAPKATFVPAQQVNNTVNPNDIPF